MSLLFYFYPGFNLQYKGLNQYSVVVTSSPCLALIPTHSFIHRSPDSLKNAHVHISPIYCGRFSSLFE